MASIQRSCNPHPALMNLPPELRVAIYTHYFRSLAKQAPTHIQNDLTRTKQPPLLLASSIIRAEARAVYYAETAFVLDFTLHNTHPVAKLADWLRTIGPHCASALTALRFQVSEQWKLPVQQPLSLQRPPRGRWAVRSCYRRDVETEVAGLIDFYCDVVCLLVDDHESKDTRGTVLVAICEVLWRSLTSRLSSPAPTSPDHAVRACGRSAARWRQIGAL